MKSQQHHICFHAGNNERNLTNPSSQTHFYLIQPRKTWTNLTTKQSEMSEPMTRFYCLNLLKSPCSNIGDNSMTWKIRWTIHSLATNTFYIVVWWIYTIQQYSNRTKHQGILFCCVYSKENRILNSLFIGFQLKSFFKQPEIRISVLTNKPWILIWVVINYIKALINEQKSQLEARALRFWVNALIRGKVDHRERESSVY